jgi:hypothetical protein
MRNAPSTGTLARCVRQHGWSCALYRQLPGAAGGRSSHRLRRPRRKARAAQLRLEETAPSLAPREVEHRGARRRERTLAHPRTLTFRRARRPKGRARSVSSAVASTAFPIWGLSMANASAARPWPRAEVVSAPPRTVRLAKPAARPRDSKAGAMMGTHPSRASASATRTPPFALTLRPTPRRTRRARPAASTQVTSPAASP